QPADEEEGEAGDDEAQADGGVVDGGEAAAPARRAAPGGVQCVQACVAGVGGGRGACGRAHGACSPAASTASTASTRAASPGERASRVRKAAALAAEVAGTSAPAWRASHAACADGSRTCTSKAITVWPVPQYSAHWPRIRPVPSARRR